MTRPRSTLVSLSDTPWYHVVNRCVRRAFLCGKDDHSGVSYDHRRGWIVDRVKQLAGVFAIDVAAYAVMSNHYHLVLRIDDDRAKGWSKEEVLRRWTQLFDGPKLVQTRLSDQAETLDDASLARVDEWAENKKDTHFNCLNKQHSLNSCPWPAPVAPPSRWPTHLSETYADNFESGWISVLFL